MPGRPKIFISYSRKDNTWLERLQVHLKPLEREGLIDPWSDTEITAGADWEAEIERALAEASAAILLISADFLASDFIRKRELQPLLEAAKEEGLLILPVILSPSRYTRMDSLSKFQAVNDPLRPLISLELWEQEQIFDRVAAAVEHALAPAGKSEAQPARSRINTVPAAAPEPWENDLGMRFVLIPAGTFQMGALTGWDNERPVHRVTISKPFCLGVHVVTQGSWKAVMGTEPWRASEYVREGGDYPAVCVSWEDAQAFIEALNAHDAGRRYRLPTEAEWEYACRAGSTTAYCFGNDAGELQAYGWFNPNAWDEDEKYAHRVGQKKPNAWGLYDMHGNVWEWVADWYGAYSPGSVTDPKGPASGSGRVVRGGGWGGLAEYMRSAVRGDTPPGDSCFDLGFRLVRESP